MNRARAPREQTPHIRRQSHRLQPHPWGWGRQSVATLPSMSSMTRMKRDGSRRPHGLPSLEGMRGNRWKNSMPSSLSKPARPLQWRTSVRNLPAKGPLQFAPRPPWHCPLHHRSKAASVAALGQGPIARSPIQKPWQTIAMGSSLAHPGSSPCPVAQKRARPNLRFSRIQFQREADRTLADSRPPRRKTTSSCAAGRHLAMPASVIHHPECDLRSKGLPCLSMAGPRTNDNGTRRHHE